MVVPSEESMRWARRRVLWSYPAVFMQLMLWNFPWSIWFFFSDDSRVVAGLWSVFCGVSCICLWITCSKEQIVGSHKCYVTTYARATFFMTLQIVILLIAWGTLG